MEKTETKKKKDPSFDWHETFSGLGVNLVKHFAESLADKVKFRVKEVVVAFQKGAIGTFLIAIGLVFFMISLVNFLNEALNMSSGFGYSMIGLFSILVGLIIIKK